MTNQNIKRIGFACKWSEVNTKGEITSVEGLNTGGTTLTWAKRNPRDIVEQKMYEVMERNITNTLNLVNRVGKLEPELRMVRLTSDMMSFYTHDDWKYFWKQPDVINRMEQLFAKVGESARANDVKLSMHPGQFTVLASANENIVEKSIEEFEYHADMVRWMGYGKTKLDFKINVHLSGKDGVAGFTKSWHRLSPEARNCITLENDEYQAGVDALLVLKDKVGIVLDIHHHWIHTQGEYITANDDRIKHIIDSWQGIRPTIHYSVSREDYLINHSPIELPNYTKLIEQGFKRQKMRAHSDGYWNSATNDWAQTHWDWADVMCESKWKNIASFKLHEEWTKTSHTYQNENETYSDLPQLYHNADKLLFDI